MTAPTLPDADTIDALDFEPELPCDACAAFYGLNVADLWIARVTNHPATHSPLLACDDHAATLRRISGQSCRCCGVVLRITVEPLR